uniref:Jasmonic acid-amido synthetase JAR1 n=1 Tax=Kalanchoe fedtschenkoi TaxID=63787 RepID=A0A7N0T4P5_KALFE
MLDKMEHFDPQQVIEEFDALTMDAERVQRETLKHILEENSQTEYLHGFGLRGRTDPESYKACIPLVDHTDLEPYIQKILEGDDSPVITGKPVATMSLSSGTTQGKRKFIPFTDELMECTLNVFRASFAFRNREFPIGKGKALQFIYGSKPVKVRDGLTAGTATTNVYRHPRFKAAMESIQSQPCSPYEVIFGPDFQQCLYCHLLCGLLYRNEIQFVSSTFAHSMVHAFRTFELIWEDLCEDIRSGELSTKITDPSVRTAMTKLLKPNPELANLIYEKCSGLSSWYGLIPALFPSAKYLFGIMTGSMEPYLPKLRHYAGELPLVSADYGASEGWIAVNVDPKSPPESVNFVVLPNIGYFEFIPARDNNQRDDVDGEVRPIGLTEVKVGEEYEIIVTICSGLYRYRLGDIVKVTGFYNSCPKLNFVCRKNLLLTINIDKNTEKDLQLSVEAATKIIANEKLEVVDFTSHVDMSSDPGHYVIFWEMNGEASEMVMNECCNCMDRSFLDAGYVSSRKVKSIGPLELRVLRKGTFHKVLEHVLKMGGTANQFKTPRCIGAAHHRILTILSNNVVKSYFSTAYD